VVGEDGDDGAALGGFGGGVDVDSVGVAFELVVPLAVEGFAGEGAGAGSA
jgi:hypothetical protein